MTNVTLSIDERLLASAREIARRRGMSLNEMIRAFLQSLAGDRCGADTADELLDLMQRQGGHSKGYKFHREDAYEGRL